MKHQIIGWNIRNIDVGIDGFMSPLDMHQSINQLEKLPVLSEIAHRLLKLSCDPLADARKLAEVVMLDASLTSQVIHWANSPLYGYKGRIESVQEAISTVLGYDYVLNLALGIAAMKPLSLPIEGPLGSWRQWQHNLSSSYLMDKINRLISSERQVSGDQVQLAALLHNLGFLLMGSQFEEEFNYLRKLVVKNPELAVIRIEDFVMATNHTLLGTWLMRAWGMPKSVIHVVYHHHNPFYRGEDALLNLITFYNDYLLGKLGVGDATTQQCPDSVYDILDISEDQEKALLDEINAQLPDIAQTVDALVRPGGRC
jgi:HD-like signal output (HDOD) protein